MPFFTMKSWRALTPWGVVPPVEDNPPTRSYLSSLPCSAPEHQREPRRDSRTARQRLSGSIEESGAAGTAPSRPDSEGSSSSTPSIFDSVEFDIALGTLWFWSLQRQNRNRGPNYLN